MTDKIALCQLDEIEDGSARGFKIGYQAIFAVHKNGEYFVYQNKCPHLQIELEWMPDQFLDMDGALIHCSTHGALFTMEDGHCIAGPCAGQGLTALNLEHNDDGDICLQQN